MHHLNYFDPDPMIIGLIVGVVITLIIVAIVSSIFKHRAG